MKKLQDLVPTEGTAKTAVILSVENPKHWAEGVRQTITKVLLNGTYDVEFSSVNSFGKYPYLNETGVFIIGGSSEIVGSSDLSIHDFLVSVGYEVSYALDNTAPKELS